MANDQSTGLEKIEFLLKEFEKLVAEKTRLESVPPWLTDPTYKEDLELRYRTHRIVMTQNLQTRNHNSRYSYYNAT